MSVIGGYYKDARVLAAAHEGGKQPRNSAQIKGDFLSADLTLILEEPGLHGGLWFENASCGRSSPSDRERLVNTSGIEPLRPGNECGDACCKHELCGHGHLALREIAVLAQLDS
jgi:hypothetical protein